MLIKLIDINLSMCSAWQKYFHQDNQTDVTIMYGSFLDLQLCDYDAVVGPGNSFGWMNGGFDGVIAKKHPEAQEKLNKVLFAHNCGELNVGAAQFACLNDNKFLVYAPTMRVPMSIVGTDNVYVSTLAALTLGNNLLMPDEVLIVPGMGTGCGGILYEEAARQMYLAWKRYSQRKLIDWKEGMAFQTELGCI